MSRTVCGICWCPYDDDTGACACEPELKAQHMTDLRTAAQQALEAMRRAVPTGEITLYAWGKAMAELEAALVEDALQKFSDVNQELMAALGCDHCNQPLYAAIKCRVCGRVTEHGIGGAPEERNFCPRCGKRTQGIHTCTPPGDSDVYR